MSYEVHSFIVTVNYSFDKLGSWLHTADHRSRRRTTLSDNLYKSITTSQVSVHALKIFYFVLTMVAGVD